MAIVNRTLDASEQKKVLSVKQNTVVNGTTMIIGIVPYPANVVGGQIAAFGLSGAPTVAVAVQRFIVGTGFTTFVIATGTSNLPKEIGTSGVGNSGIVMAAQGSTLLQLQANDLLIAVQAGGTGAATNGTAVDILIQPIVDIKTHYALGL